MRVSRWIAAVVACVAIGVAGPAVATTRGAHPLTSYNVSVSGFLAQVNCSQGDVQWTGAIINDASSSVTGVFRVVVDGNSLYGDTSQGVSAHSAVGLAGDFLLSSYTTAYAEWVPSGSVWKVKKVHVDFPDNKDCG